MGGRVLIMGEQFDRVAHNLVAEHIMLYKRQPHQGNSMSTTDLGSDGSESCFYCRWCGERITNERIAEPCPVYPLPAFNLRDLLRRLGALGYHVCLRVDPRHDFAPFVLFINAQRIVTDTPLLALTQHLAIQYQEDTQFIAKEVEYGT